MEEKKQKSNIAYEKQVQEVEERQQQSKFELEKHLNEINVRQQLLKMADEKHAQEIEESQHQLKIKIEIHSKEIDKRKQRMKIEIEKHNQDIEEKDQQLKIELWEHTQEIKERQYSKIKTEKIARELEKRKLVEFFFVRNVENLIRLIFFKFSIIGVYGAAIFELNKKLIKNLPFVQQSTQKLDQFLHYEENIFCRTLEKIESFSRISSLNLAIALIITFTAYMIFGYYGQLICNTIGFLYPIYATLKAIISPEIHDRLQIQQLLRYWVVFGLFNVAAFYLRTLFHLIPYYWILRTYFLVWCISPIENNGSDFLYFTVIQPVFKIIKSYVDHYFPEKSSGINQESRRGSSSPFFSSLRKRDLRKKYFEF